ncbi:protein SRG1-like [Nicotiana tabacum]|uniref:Protein SRG1-like n=2 Tax=Nicotiana TaxID=4085 RepID=A0A1S4BN48_TOBAC|nr:PREDICTED: protein SRG1-like [Nicotiana sylvestris]XP_016490272.1 PREDICTED: protein SRG1-like [Nicotiana tabacum]
MHFFAAMVYSLESSKELESSISLQEITKEPVVSIPIRYLCIDEEPSLLSEASLAPAIPTIDSKALVMEQTRGSELERLHLTCKEWGIFQLVNHGVSSSIMEKLKYEIEKFYRLPLEEKMRYKVRPGDFEGYGQKAILHSQDQKGFDWADRFYMITNPVQRRKLHLLPQLPPSLRETLEVYLSELQKLAKVLLWSIADTLKIAREEVDKMFNDEDGMQSVRMTYYPPCPKPELVMGFRPHSDATGITILHQVNGVDGFQVKKDGVWIPVHFLPNAFVVNLGDILEVSSNGLYKSIEHRATVNSSIERISIAMFFNPKFEAEVGPAASLINQDNPPAFKTVKMEKLVKDYFSRKQDGKSFLEHLRISKGKTAQ